jgi:hypothetical protein
MSNLIHPDDIKIASAIVAKYREKYLGKVKIYLAIGGVFSIVTRFLGVPAAEHGLNTFIIAIQASCIGLVLYATWQLLTPRGKKFRKFLLHESTDTLLRKSLTEQGWQTLLKIRNNRKGSSFCVDDILISLEGNKKYGVKS